MVHDTLALLVLVVLTHVPLIYGAVFCSSEKPMRRLLAWTHAMTELLEQLRRR